MNTTKQANKKHDLQSKVLIVDERKMLVLIKKREKLKYVLVGGFIEENESPRTALTREIFEETGVKLSIVEFSFLSSIVLRREGKKKDITKYYFVYRKLNDKKFINNEPHKFDGIDWVDWEEAIDYLNVYDREAVIKYFINQN